MDQRKPGENEAHRLEDMDQRLYRRDLADRKEPRFDSLSPRRASGKAGWMPITDEHKEKVAKVASHPTFFKRFFVFALGFAALAVLIVFITFFTGGNTVSNSNIEIRVLGNSFTAGGDELPLQIDIVNKNATPLELADLFVEYEKGGDQTGGAGRVRNLYSLGTVGAGKTASKNVFVSLYGEEGAEKNIDLTLQYRIRGSNAIFVKKLPFPVTISSAPVALTVDGPTTITPNQQVTLKVKVVSNAKDPVQKMLLTAEFPTGFKFASSDPSPAYLNNVWLLGDMAPGAERTVTITGTIFGQDGEDRAFHFYTGAASQKDQTKIGLTYNSLTNVVSLVKPFLASTLFINGSSNETVAVPSASTVHVSVNWANNLPTKVTDVEIAVQFSGNAIDASTVDARNGFYNSANNTIVWNKTTDGKLASVEPSDSGTEDFSFRVKPLISSGGSISSPSISFTVSIKGKQPDQGGAVAEVAGTETKKAIVSSDLGFAAQAYYASGPFANTGPTPPKAGQPTTYTVTWTVTNSANALSSAEAHAFLPTYVEWVGTSLPASEKIEYDPTTRTVRWNIGSVAPGAGTGTASRSVSFQVRLTPSNSQIGSLPKLVLDASASARDSFTGELLSATRAAISTRLDNDSSGGNGVVTN